MDNLKKFGATVKGGVEKVGGEVKHGFIDARDQAQLVTDHILHPHDSEFEDDEKLVQRYQRVLKQYVAGLKYSKRLLKNLLARYWPQLFKVNLRVARGFHNLVADIQFKGIDEYYAMWDEQQAYEVVPQLDPHQNFDVIAAVNDEHHAYETTIEKLAMLVDDEWSTAYSALLGRIDEVIGTYVKRARQLAKVWHRKRLQYDKVRRRIDKLGKQQGDLDDKQKLQLLELTLRMEQALAEFTAVNQRFKLTMPQLVELLDDFTDEITKRIIYQHVWLITQVRDELAVFAVHYGLGNDDALVPLYEQIIDDWHRQFTVAKDEIETIVNPTDDVLDKALDPKAVHWLNNVTKLLKRPWTFHPADGIFNDELEADPLELFVEYNDATTNRLLTYFPSKVVDRPHQGSIVDVELSPLPLPTSDVPPPLPPRTNRPLPPVPPALPPRPLTQTVPSLAAKDATPLPKPPAPRRTDLALSLESVALLADDNALEVLLVALSLALDDVVKTLGADQINRRLADVYNTHKNEITQCPIPEYSTALAIQYRPVADVNGAFKLTRLQLLFEQYAEVEGQPRTALHTFKGTHPGDLSFAQGDVLDVVLDLQLVASTYLTQGNWLLARKNGRMGFIPSTYID